MAVIVGIDPGLHGAIISINEKDDVVVIQVIDMPTIRNTKTKLRYDVKGIVEVFNRLIHGRADMVFIEKAQILPRGFTIKSNVGLAFCEGVFTGLFEAFDIKYTMVNPQQWHKHFGISGKKGNTKEQSMIIASKLYPTVEFKTPKGRILDGRADALLIATYGKWRVENAKQ